MAGKTNATASQIDKTSYFWTGLCGICHPGGGPSEFDRDGRKYWSAATGHFGYETLGRTAAQVALDGDYALVSTSGALSPAPWHVTGVAEADCLMCHRRERAIVNGMNMNWIWRSGTLRGGAALVDQLGSPVPAYAAAATAGQGWLSAITLPPQPPGVPPLATMLQVDYQPGVSGGSLVAGAGGSLALSGASIAGRPVDFACWGCHATADTKKRGDVWFNAQQDVHYAAFNHLDDADPSNDVPPGRSTACTRCHPSGAGHDLAKGDEFLSSVQNETDFAGFRTCGGCHAAEGPDRDPRAPVPTSPIHTRHGHQQKLSCEFCHIPFKRTAADQAVDNATTGSTIGYSTAAFLSADPLNPGSPDKTRWYPSFKWRHDRDGFDRLYPVKALLSSWWGDWDRNGTPGALGDDIVQPVILWRVRQITGGAPLPGVTDDNGDGKPEVNRPAEIALCLQALKGNDSHGNPVAANPVLVKGGRIWFEDPSVPEGVGSFPYEGTGIKVESEHPFMVSHDVLPASQALGAASCGDCHPYYSGGLPTPVFDRRILVDPFDVNSLPAYKTVRQITGLSPF